MLIIITQTSKCCVQIKIYLIFSPFLLITIRLFFFPDTLKDSTCDKFQSCSISPLDGASSISRKNGKKDI